MKENKFRIWDEYIKKMVDTGYHVIGEFTVFGLIDQYAQENPRKEADKSKEHYEGSLMRYNDFVEMQWIGLKDKNGQDIYEGDILRFDYINHQHDLGKVEYLSTGYYIISNGIPLSFSQCSNLVVAGNIYENPTLMDYAHE